MPKGFLMCFLIGAGNENRTRNLSLGSWCFTTKLCPQQNASLLSYEMGKKSSFFAENGVAIRFYQDGSLLAETKQRIGSFVSCRQYLGNASTVMVSFFSSRHRAFSQTIKRYPLFFRIWRTVVPRTAVLRRKKKSASNAREGGIETR